MPLFEFVCDDCGSRRDEFVDSPADAPECCGGKTRRVYSSIGLALGPNTALMSDGERFMHLRHKQDIEQAYRNGKLSDCNERGPIEFRPDFSKK